MSLPHSGDAPIGCTDLDEIVDSLEWQPYTYLIYEDGGRYYVKDGETMVIIYDAEDADVAIQYAEDLLEAGSGGVIEFKEGTYWTETDIDVHVEDMTILWRGASKSDTIIRRRAAVDGGDATGMIRLTGDKEFSLQQLTLNGNNRAAYGVDAASTAIYGQQLDMYSCKILNIDGYCIDAANATGVSAPGIQDSLYSNCNFETSTGGLNLRAQIYKFNRCNFGSLTDEAVNIHPGNHYDFDSCVFTGNDKDFDFDAAYDGSIFMLTCRTCWFEGSDTHIIASSVAGANSPFSMDLVFDHCYFNSDVTASTAIDFTNIRGRIWIEGYITDDPAAAAPSLNVGADATWYPTFYHQNIRIAWTGGGGGVQDNPAPTLSSNAIYVEDAHIIWENWGTAEASNTDTITHGLPGTPDYVFLNVEENDSAYAAQAYNMGAANFTLYLYDIVAGAAETVDKTIHWYAVYER